MPGRRSTSKLKACVLLAAACVLTVSASQADARRIRELAKGVLIGAGVGVLLDGPGRGVLSGATAGLLVAAIGRRGRSD